MHSRGEDMSRGKRIDPDAFLAELASHAPSHLQAGGFTSVVRNPGMSLKRIREQLTEAKRKKENYAICQTSAHRGDQDYTARYAEAPHLTTSRLGGEEYPICVYVHDLKSQPLVSSIQKLESTYFSELILRILEAVNMVHENARSSDTDVDSFLLVPNFFDSRPDAFLVGDVAGNVLESGTVIHPGDKVTRSLPFCTTLFWKVKTVDSAGPSFAECHGHL